MKHFYISVLLLVAFFAISCVPTHDPIKDDKYKLSGISYTYQEVDGHQFMVIRASLLNNERRTYIIPTNISNTNQTDINLELQNFKDWYKSNRIYDDNYFQNTEHIDVALSLFSEYYERYND